MGLTGKDDCKGNAGKPNPWGPTCACVGNIHIRVLVAIVFLPIVVLLVSHVGGDSSASKSMRGFSIGRRLVTWRRNNLGDPVR
jgi:hypothetical protein